MKIRLVPRNVDQPLLFPEQLVQQLRPETVLEPRRVYAEPVDNSSRPSVPGPDQWPKDDTWQPPDPPEDYDPGDPLEPLSAESAEELIQLAGFLDQDMAIASPAMFTQAVSGGYWKLYRHLALLDEYLLRAINGEFPRLIVTMPPQHGKSVLISEHLPTWYLGHFPDNAVMLASYETKYAMSYGRKSRELMERWGPALFGVQVDRKTRTMDNWGIEGHRGIMQTAGAGGAITGKKANLLLIDDPVKNAADALSIVKRQSNKDWFRTTSSTRLHEGGAIIVVQTRWHDDDLAGWLAREFPDIWKIVNLPAIAWGPGDLPENERQPDPLGRKPGEALCPLLHSIKSLREKIRMMGPGWFSALYQGRPVCMGGGIIKCECFKYWSYGKPAKAADNTTRCYQLPEHFDYIIQSWDMTYKETSDSDWVVGQIWGVKGADRYLLAQFRDRVLFPQAVEAVKQLSLSHFGRYSREKLVELRANGPGVVAVLESKIIGMQGIEPKGSKEARVSGITFQIESGNVYIPHPDQPGCEWVLGFLEECGSFPKGRHDDQVDCMSQALEHLFQLTGNAGFQHVEKMSEVQAGFAALDALQADRQMTEQQVRAAEGQQHSRARHAHAGGPVGGYDQALKSAGGVTKIRLGSGSAPTQAAPSLVAASRVNLQPASTMLGNRKISLGGVLDSILRAAD